VLFSDGVRKPPILMTDVWHRTPQKTPYRPARGAALEQLQKCGLEASKTARGAHQADDLTLLIVRYTGLRGHHGH